MAVLGGWASSGNVRNPAAVKPLASDRSDEESTSFSVSKIYRSTSSSSSVFCVCPLISTTDKRPTLPFNCCCCWWWWKLFPGPLELRRLRTGVASSCADYETDFRSTTTIHSLRNCISYLGPFSSSSSYSSTSSSSLCHTKTNRNETSPN